LKIADAGIELTVLELGGDRHESRVVFRCGPDCRNLVNDGSECRKNLQDPRQLQMLGYDVAFYFGRAVQQTFGGQLRRMSEDGDGQGLARLRRLVGMQQSGVQELTRPRRE
jgi:hypothetical protein